MEDTTLTNGKFVSLFIYVLGRAGLGLGMLACSKGDHDSKFLFLYMAILTF